MILHMVVYEDTAGEPFLSAESSTEVCSSGLHQAQLNDRMIFKEYVT